MSFFVSPSSNSTCTLSLTMAALRVISRLPRTRAFPAVPLSRRYGTEESGHPGSKSAPRRDIEHPGPAAPDTSGSPKSSSKSSSSSSGQSSDQPSSTSMSQSGAQSDKGSPAIHQPESASESEDPEVSKHNEEMRNRADKSVNQLSEDDNKVRYLDRKHEYPLKSGPRCLQPTGRAMSVIQRRAMIVSMNAGCVSCSQDRRVVYRHWLLGISIEYEYYGARLSFKI